MEIEKAKKLLLLDGQGQLPLSHSLSEQDKENGLYRLYLLAGLGNLFSGDCHNLVSKKRLLDAIIKNPLVESFKYSRDCEQASVLKTVFGETLIFNIHAMFKHNKIPSFVKPNNCYYNCQMALQIEGATKQITGKLNFDRAFLHSVVVLGSNKNVIDFNNFLIMDYDFYIKLTNFEILNEITREELIEEIEQDYYKTYSDYAKANGDHLDYGQIALSHQEIVEKAKQLKPNKNTNV